MSLDKFSEEERIAFYNAIAELDPKKVYVNYDKEADTLSYTDKIKSYEIITGKPGDEEITRALILLHLILTYGHKPETIEIENTFSIGGRGEEGARAVKTDIYIKNDTKEISISGSTIATHPSYPSSTNFTDKKGLFTY